MAATRARVCSSPKTRSEIAAKALIERGRSTRWRETGIPSTVDSPAG